MASGQTALDLIKGAMRLVGVIATGETPSPDEANDGLNTLNDLLETWTTENLSVYGELNESFNTVGGQGSPASPYTIGPSGNFNTVRPVRIAGAYCTFNGVDFPIDLIGQDEYNLISLKTMQQPIVQKMLYVPENPLGKILLWPVPSGVIPLVMSTDRILTSVATLSTVIIYPPGYYIAMKHALAIMLAPDYGATPSVEVTTIATVTKANIKRANKQKRVARFDEALTSGDPVIWQTGA